VSGAIGRGLLIEVLASGSEVVSLLEVTLSVVVVEESVGVVVVDDVVPLLVESLEVGFVVGGGDGWRW
jgi:hypothetical protein